MCICRMENSERMFGVQGILCLGAKLISILMYCFMQLQTANILVE